MGSLFQYKDAGLINALGEEREMKGEGEVRCGSEEIASYHIWRKKKKGKKLNKLEYSP